MSIAGTRRREFARLFLFIRGDISLVLFAQIPLGGVKNIALQGVDMDYSPEEEFMNQSQFAKRWAVSRQYISKLVRRGHIPKLGGLVDTVFADAFMKRNGIGVLNIPLDPVRREQFLKRLERRRELTGC